MPGPCPSWPKRMRTDAHSFLTAWNLKNLFFLCDFNLIIIVSGSRYFLTIHCFYENRPPPSTCFAFKYLRALPISTFRRLDSPQVYLGCACTLKSTRKKYKQAFFSVFLSIFLVFTTLFHNLNHHVIMVWETLWVQRGRVNQRCPREIWNGGKRHSRRFFACAHSSL